MISFKQLEGTPPDIEVTTDDGDAEMAAIEEALRLGEFEESTAWVNFFACDTRNEEENFVFVMPGDEVADIGDFYEPLESFIEEANLKAIAAAQEAAEKVDGG